MPGTDLVQVAVRVKPLLPEEREAQVQTCVRAADTQVVVGGERTYAFDHVYDPHATSENIFDNLVTPLIDTAFLQGYNATVFAYGQTGAGKTHTMTAVVDQSIRRIFHAVAREEEDHAARAAVSGGHDDGALPPTVSISMLELYNEHVVDLLTNGPITGATTSQSLQIREDPERGVVVSNLQECPVETEADVRRIIELGQQTRTTAATLLNQTSSRSHMIITLYLRHNGAISKMHFVDLAGSERIKKSLGPLRPVANANQAGGGQSSHGAPIAGSTFAAAAASGAPSASTERLKECIAINSGLLALGNVITALCKKQGHVPFRSSKLTRLLQDSLAGNCRTAMIACVSAATSNFEETLSTLKYAYRAKSLTTRPVQNVTMSADEAASIIAQLRSELQAAKQTLADHGLNVGDAPGGPPGAAAHTTPAPRTPRGGPSYAEREQARHERAGPSLREQKLDGQVAELRQQLLQTTTELDREKRLVATLERDLFRAEFDAMNNHAALKKAHEQMAALQSGADPSDADCDDADCDGTDDDGTMADLRSQRARVVVDMADAVVAGTGGESDDDVAVQRLRMELEDKARTIADLTDAYESAEHRLDEYQSELARATDERRRLDDELRHALSRLERSDVESQRKEHQRQQLCASYAARLKVAEHQATELRRRTEEARAQLRQKASARDQVMRLKNESAALMEKLREQQEKERRNASRTRVAHTHEMHGLQKELRETRAENKRMAALLRKRDDELRGAMQQHRQTHHSQSRSQSHRSAGSHGASHVDPTATAHLSAARQRTATRVETATKQLYEELNALSELEKEVEEVKAECDKRRAMVSAVETSAPRQRSQRALEAWKFYLAQLENKIAASRDANEVAELERKVDETAAHIRAIEEELPAVSIKQEQDLRDAEEVLDSLVAKRTFHLKTVRALQAEVRAAQEEDARTTGAENASAIGAATDAEVIAEKDDTITALRHRLAEKDTLIHTMHQHMRGASGPATIDL